MAGPDPQDLTAASAVPALLTRIAQALERLAPPAGAPLDLSAAAAFVWRGEGRLDPVTRPRRVPLSLLTGIDEQKARVVEGFERFARGLPANHMMLWGARGTGKSALVKAAHADVALRHPDLKLVEIPRTGLPDLPRLLDRLPRDGAGRVALFVDDLSFEAADEAYKGLKSALDGSLGGADVLVAVTSNRRHIVNRQNLARDGAADFRPDETMEEQVALSDRFGLWLGFHPMDQATWLAAVRATLVHLGLDPARPGLESEALQWAARRGSRSGRSAWQFCVDQAGAARPATDVPSTL